MDSKVTAHDVFEKYATQKCYIHCSDCPIYKDGYIVYECPDDDQYQTQTCCERIRDYLNNGPEFTLEELEGD